MGTCLQAVGLEFVLLITAVFSPPKLTRQVAVETWGERDDTQAEGMAGRASFVFEQQEAREVGRARAKAGEWHDRLFLKGHAPAAWRTD